MMRLFDFLKVLSKNDAPEPFEGIGTVLLAQTVGLSELSEVADVHGVLSAFSKHCEAQKLAVTQSGGRVVQLIGGSVMAYWSSNHHADQAMACALSLTSLEPTLACRVALGTGELLGAFVGPKKKFMLLGAAMSEAKQLDQCSCALKNVVLFTQSTMDSVTQFVPEYVTVGFLADRKEIFACAK